MEEEEGIGQLGHKMRFNYKRKKSLKVQPREASPHLSLRPRPRAYVRAYHACGVWPLTPI